LGTDWAHCYSNLSPSRGLIENMMQTWHLVNIVNNDFHSTHGLFPLFEGLELKDMNKEFEVPYTNGSAETNDANGLTDASAVSTKVNGVNGLSASSGSSETKATNGVNGFTETSGTNGLNANDIENVPLVNGTSH